MASLGSLGDMTPKPKNKNTNKPGDPNYYTQPNINKRRTVAGIFLAPVALAASVAAFAQGNKLLDRVTIDKADAALAEAGQPHKTYIAKYGDRIWNIANAAFPEDNTHDRASKFAEDVANLEDQIPRDKAHKDGNLLLPGDKFELPIGSKIGHLVSKKEVDTVVDPQNNLHKLIK